MSTIVNKPEVVKIGERSTFSVSTSLPSPYKYNWRKNGVLIPRAPSELSYTTLPLTKEDFGSRFSCIVYSAGGIEESDEVMLELPKPAIVEIKKEKS